MAAVELHEAHVVAQASEFPGDPPSARLDRQNGVPGAVGYKKPGRAPPDNVGDKAREKATTRENRSPLASPRVSAVARAVGEPPRLIRAGSTFCRRKPTQGPVEKFDIGA